MKGDYVENDSNTNKINSLAIIQKKIAQNSQKNPNSSIFTSEGDLAGK